MKKIGLCVCYNTKNYGSQLQVLATQLKVQALGYDYEIIRYKKKYDLKMVLKSAPRVFNPWLVRGKLTTLRKKRQLRKYPEIRGSVPKGAGCSADLLIGFLTVCPLCIQDMRN